HLMFPLFSGLGAMYWRHKHNGLHHGHPNVLGQDPDIDIWPMASCRADYESSGRLRRWFQRNLQGYLFWPLTTLMPTVMRIPSIKFVIADLGKRGLTRANAADALCLTAHYTLWLVVPSVVWGPLETIALYMSLWCLVGVLLSLIFAPAHIGLPITSNQFRDWLHQLETTRNLRVPAWLRYLFIGLDYQVEHHLFPTIPHQNMARACVIVRAWCLELGLEHQEVGYRDALVSVTSFIRDAWDYEAGSREDLRRRTNASSRQARTRHPGPAGPG
ncbi:MAG: fatty acid desaturase, partial [Proteobacteria bacterium]|nr:fatty acid desaturase [Pseudomonadota bacterium]